MRLSQFFVQQYDYIKWADNLCLDAARTVHVDSYHKESGFSFGTIQKTLLHMMGAQLIWVGRWKGDSNRQFPTVAEVPTLVAAADRWRMIHDELLGFVRQQTEDSLNAKIDYFRRGDALQAELWKLMNHCGDHANFHRGQLNSLIKLAGGKPAATMYVDYARQMEG